MSWMVTLVGRSTKMAEVVKQKFIDTQGCPKGTDEEAAKNALGEIAETLCKSLIGDVVVTISASGSAWNEDGKARSQQCKFEFTTHYGEFIE